MKQNSRFMMALRSGLAALTLMVLALPAFAQKVEVKGTVTDAESGQPLTGVTIIADSGSGTTTDGSGHYSLSVGSNESIVFDYLGYISKTEKVAGRTTINVAMQVDAKSIEEVVVLGYTTQKKAEISSSIVSLDSEALNDLTTSDVGSMLQGKAAGVLVMSASGQPGEAADIRIRGTGSITAGAGPLYVVDGVAGGSFNPNDVETITILKDAAATALYGASASGGVIVVTTKSAQSDKPVVNFKATAGIKRANMGRFSPMGSEELYYAHKAMFSKGLFKIQRPESLLEQDFDWVNKAFRTGVVQDYYASVAGRSGKTNYFVSIDHYDEEGSLVNTNFERSSARVNLSTALSDNLQLDIRLSYDRSGDQQASSYVTLEGAYRALPWDIPYVQRQDEEGNWYVTDEVLYVDSAKRSDNGQPWYSHDKYNVLHNELYNFARNKSEQTVADVQLSWQINDWLMLTSTNRFDTSNWFYEHYIDPRTKSPSYSNGYIYNATGSGVGFGTTNLLKAHKEFGDHSIDGIVGWEYGHGFSQQMWAGGTDMPNGQASLSSAVMLEQGGYNHPSTSWAWLAQAQYSYQGKYVATASVRYDEIYKFAPKARGGYFPGVSAAWLVSKEDFMLGNDVFTFLKIRGGYGKTGNDNIDAFLYQDTYSLSAKYEDIVAAVLERQANPNLGWEEAYMTSFGIDATLFNNVNVTLELYNTKNTNLLLAVPQATSTGFFEFMDNVGTIRNRGIELAVDGNIINTRDLTWNVGMNIGMNRNSVVYLPNGEFLQANSSGLKQQVKEGQSLNTWYMPKWMGVDPANGDPLWEVVEEDGTTRTTNAYAEATHQAVGCASPLFSGGVNTTLTYKNWSFSMNGAFVVGNKIFNYARVSMDADGAYSDYNMQSHDNGLGWTRWEQEGDIATHPKLVLNGNKASNSISSRYLEDGSFFRLRNITIGYTLPKSLTDKLSMQSARVFVSADNIFTLTKFSGMDPEVRLESSAYELAGTYSTNYPVPMSITAGIDVKF